MPLILMWLLCNDEQPEKTLIINKIIPYVKLEDLEFYMWFIYSSPQTKTQIFLTLLIYKKVEFSDIK